jgi:hypothetical protein
MLPLVHPGNLYFHYAESNIPVVRDARLAGDIPQNLNFALSSGAIRTFLDANEVHYPSTHSTKKLDPSRIENLAKKTTLLMVCSR